MTPMEFPRDLVELIIMSDCPPLRLTCWKYYNVYKTNLLKLVELHCTIKTKRRCDIDMKYYGRSIYTIYTGQHQHYIMKYDYFNKITVRLEVRLGIINSLTNLNKIKASATGSIDICCEKLAINVSPYVWIYFIEPYSMSNGDQNLLSSMMYAVTIRDDLVKYLVNRDNWDITSIPVGVKFIEILNNMTVLKDV